MSINFSADFCVTQSYEATQGDPICSGHPMDRIDNVASGSYRDGENIVFWNKMAQIDLGNFRAMRHPLVELPSYKDDEMGCLPCFGRIQLTLGEFDKFLYDSILESTNSFYTWEWAKHIIECLKDLVFNKDNADAFVILHWT